MKLITNIIRVFTGLLFVFSGFIKLNDPIGFSLKLEEYFNVFRADLTPKSDSLKLTIQFSESSKTEKYAIAINQDSFKKINISTDQWHHMAKDDGQAKQYYDGTTIKLSVDGQNLYIQEIRKPDAKPFELVITGSINQKICLQKTFPIYNNKDIRYETALNLESSLKKEHWLAKVCDFLIPFALLFAILLCIIELFLGMALLIGYKHILNLWFMAILMVFFTFLTWYSAYFNKVTDCGCFGNAIPLSPWQSFAKDVVLSCLIGALFVLRKNIKALFSPSFSWKLLVGTVTISFGFALYCWYYLPVFNFLKFEKGNNIEKLTQLPPNAKQEIREMVFIYTKAGKDFEFSTQQLLDNKIAENPSYHFKTRIDKVVEEGDKAEIHDFMLNDESGMDQISNFFEKDEYKLLMVSDNLTQARPRAMKKIAAIATEWSAQTKFKFWALTSSAPSVAEALRHEYQMPFKFYYGDNTSLKSIVRSNPGLLLFKKGTIIAIWPSTDLPNIKELKRKIKG